MVKFARVLVDVEISDKLPHSISFVNKRGQLVEQLIEYEWLPTKCSVCKILGHAASSCRKEQNLVWQPKKEQGEASEKVDGNRQGEAEPVSDKMDSTSVVPELSKVSSVHDEKDNNTTTEAQDQVWTTPKRVSGVKHVNEVSQPSKINQYSVLQDGQLEVLKQGKITKKKSLMEGGNLLCWNVRGLNSRNKQKSLYDFCRSNKIGLGAFLESKLRGSKIEDMMTSVFRDWKFYSIPIVEGRILLVWKEDLFKISIIGVEDQFIHCTVKIMGVMKPFFLTVIYGRNQLEERKRLWQALESQSLLVQPWLVAGDFNAIFDFDDRIGGRSITDMEKEDACNWRANCLMSEIRRIGAQFTWSNKQKEGSQIFSKLDRVFSNEAWTDAFPNSEAHFNWDVISDHCYYVIKLVLSQISGLKPFKFFNMWTNHEKFREIVLNSWCTKGVCTDLKGISQKLIKLKSVLVQFNRRTIGDIPGKYLAAKEKYQQAQYLLQQQPQSKELHRAEQEACSEFTHYSKMHESFLRQQSKITAYVNDHGQIVDCYEDVIKHFVSHFEGFLGSPSSATARIQLAGINVGNILSIDQQLSLVRPFSKKDVKEAMFSIHSVKSLGLDGLPKSLNRSIIALVPKSDSPSTVIDYRPIACCNTLYKCISKMLSARLSTVLPYLTHQNQGAFIKHRSMAHNIFILQDILKGYSRKNISNRCLVKLDLSKAYDSVDWYFLEDLLNAYCFRSRFISWIMVCLKGASYSLLLNGRLHGAFSGMKGLRQGDPISPLLFVLIMEYLTRLLLLASQQKEFRFHPLCKHLKLVNLCFADDLLLFCKGSYSSVKILFDGF
ncbi:uncharacterized protein LOC133814585 [Humulus lupulus]|uniref:uncharacterized protein LOC133814585 n=1 Tax=Humulus lupulus TaxID=3486 RepID=UPI002B40BAF0|nr:uncharacterized protein LOC133814585 [Humulus lupulus]